MKKKNGILALNKKLTSFCQGVQNDGFDMFWCNASQLLLRASGARQPKWWNVRSHSLIWARCLPALRPSCLFFLTLVKRSSGCRPIWSETHVESLWEEQKLFLLFLGCLSCEKAWTVQVRNHLEALLAEEEMQACRKFSCVPCFLSACWKGGFTTGLWVDGCERRSFFWRTQAKAAAAVADGDGVKSFQDRAYNLICLPRERGSRERTWGDFGPLKSGCKCFKLAGSKRRYSSEHPKKPLKQPWKQPLKQPWQKPLKKTSKKTRIGY